MPLASHCPVHATQAERAEQQRVANEAAMAESRARKELDEQDWLAFAHSVTASSSSSSSPSAASEKGVVTEVSLTLTQSAEDEDDVTSDAT